MGEERAAALTLRILDRSGGETRYSCDSVRLPEREEKPGVGGGTRGIRRGHICAVIALGEGVIHAALGSKPVAEYPISGGVASVEKNMITIFPL